QDRAKAVEDRDTATATLKTEGPRADKEIAQAEAVLTAAKQRKQALFAAVEDAVAKVDSQAAAVRRLRGAVPEFAAQHMWLTSRDLLSHDSSAVRDIGQSLRQRLLVMPLHPSISAQACRDFVDLAHRGGHWAHAHWDGKEFSPAAWSEFAATVDAEMVSLLDKLDRADASAGAEMREAFGLLDLYLPA
ncbi:MAG TPA: hypothetical protein VM165_14200, partial [Planctomycetaceae bacterium]|nr:hypothetical protein [Planctomycetaceae bacterium]